MKKILNKTTIQKLKQLFSRKKEVLAVYAFGSQVNGYAGKKSDLDLAIFVKDKKQVGERDILKPLINENIKFPFEIDLTVVDFTSPPLLLFQIVKNGQCLYKKSRLIKNELETKTILFYYDNQHMRNIYSHYLKKSLDEGTYGYR